MLIYYRDNQVIIPAAVMKLQISQQDFGLLLNCQICDAVWMSRPLWWSWSGIIHWKQLWIHLIQQSPGVAEDEAGEVRLKNVVFSLQTCLVSSNHSDLFSFSSFFLLHISFYLSLSFLPSPICPPLLSSLLRRSIKSPDSKLLFESISTPSSSFMDVILHSLSSFLPPSLLSDW